MSSSADRLRAAAVKAEAAALRAAALLDGESDGVHIDKFDDINVGAKAEAALEDEDTDDEEDNDIVLLAGASTPSVTDIIGRA